MMFPLCRLRLAFSSLLATLLIVFVLPYASAAASDADVIAAGERLVHNMDCNVCHTPKIFTPQGPQPDPSRLLSGFPAEEKLPAIPEGLIGPEAWGGLFNNHLTAWAGPWGISFGSNLTPDPTGIGSWTEEIFVEAMRSGKNVGKARPFLPPMPTYSRLTDEELHAIYTYLRSIKPVKNTVSEAIPPAQPAKKESSQPVK